MEDRVFKMLEEKVKWARTSIEEQWKLQETRILETLRLGRIELKDLLNQFETQILMETKRMLLMDPIPNSTTPDPKNMELRFSNKISQPILTCHEIKGEDNNCIQVVLHDSSTRNRVDIGPVASASVEIVVLGQGTDDWTGEEFDKKIVAVEGKLPLLNVNVCKLQGGIGILGDIKFRHHATEVKPAVFRLGARIVEKFDGIIVKEAKTESFVVKCYRNKYAKKNEIPCPFDKVWVLKNIQKGRNINKRLQAKGIHTVEEFLIQLLINPQELENIVGLKGKKWEATVNHARKCQSGKKYLYFNSQGNSGIVFGILGKLQGLYSGGQYADTDMLSENNKVDADKLLSSAFEHWEEVTSFDDPYSLQQHLEAVKTSLDPSKSRIPGRNPDTGAFEMVDESNNIEVPGPLFVQGMPISDMNPLARSESFGIHEVDFIDDLHFWQLDQLSGLDHGTRFNGLDIGCVVYGARMGGSGSVAAESKVGPCCKALRNWKTLFCVSKWILIRKKLNSEEYPTRKKQKVC